MYGQGHFRSRATYRDARFPSPCDTPDDIRLARRTKGGSSCVLPQSVSTLSKQCTCQPFRGKASRQGMNRGSLWRTSPQSKPICTIILLLVLHSASALVRPISSGDLSGFRSGQRAQPTSMLAAQACSPIDPTPQPYDRPTARVPVPAIRGDDMGMGSYSGTATTWRDAREAGRVLGLGVCGVDLLAYVAKFPNPDDKIRTTAFQVQGGGNAGNTLTGLARLGIRASIMTKVGGDAYGRMILDELESDGVNTAPVVVKSGKTSPFTYVLVDTETLTRTCIHTPSEDVLEDEVHEGLLDGVSLLHLDSRNTQAAVKLAQLAKARGIPIVIDAEKDRPYLRDLIPYATFICTNTVFPVSFTSSATVEEGMVSLLECGDARFVSTTLGAEGSMLMCRSGDLQLLDEGPLPVSVSVSKYTHLSKKEYDVVRCGVWPIKVEEIVDTTGAGDAFISGIIYGLLHGHSAARMLNLASFVASSKLKGPGARAGLPKRDSVPPALM